ncbi:uncharacterized protein LOC129572121 [Sitodiplosis mosellana]|uniref:uncharacterized protein LOC129572121 n=1 Tax=Sitodiplosis mosellana TaxID=263140 RepID=UPI002444E638|nr:uncharacterized protein LOC129572121 [Sitodiplosis mosellana]
MAQLKYKIAISLFILICSTNYVTIALYGCNKYILGVLQLRVSYVCGNLELLDIQRHLTKQLKESNETKPINLMLSKIVLPDSFNGELPKDWFNTNISVRYLHLRYLNIKKIGADAFESEKFEKLRELVISDIPAISFVSSSFRGLSNLWKLVLINIQTFHFEENVLAPVANLQNLIINCRSNEPLWLDNLLGTVKMDQLVQVRISHCNLNETITETTFSGLQSVIELNLNHNNIERLGERSLDVVLQSTHYLHLSVNKLTALPIELFENRRDHLLQVTVSRNPWHCDSNMEKLHRFIHSDSTIHFGPMVCKTPPECEGFHVEKSASFCGKNEEKVMLAEEEIAEEREVQNVATTVSVLSIALPPSEVEEIWFSENEERDFLEIVTSSPDSSVSVTEADDLIQCNYQNKKLTLLKRSLKKFPSICRSNDEMEVDAVKASTDYQLVAIAETPRRRILSCLTSVNIGEKKMVNLNENLKSIGMYRFCWMEKGNNTIAPWDCFVFHFKLDDVEDAWLLVEHKPIAVAIFILIAVLGLLIGILQAILLTKLFSQQKVDRKQTLKRTFCKMSMTKKRRVRFRSITNTHVID